MHSAVLQPFLGQHVSTIAEAHLGKLVLASELQTHILTRSLVHESHEEWLHSAAFDLSNTKLVTAEQKRAQSVILLPEFARMHQEE